MLYALVGLLIVLVVLVIAVTIRDVSDIARGNTYPTKTISATGEAKISVKPDVAYLFYDIVAEEKDEKGAREKYQKKMRDFLAGLKALGMDINASNVATTAFSMNKDETAENAKRYKATVSVQVKIEDKKAIDDTLKAVYDVALKHDLEPSAAAGYNQCAGFKDQTEYMTPELRRQATENAWKKAAELVLPTGLRLGAVVGAASYDSSAYYPPAGSCSYPVPGIPLAPVELTTSVNLTFEVR